MSEELLQEPNKQQEEESTLPPVPVIAATNATDNDATENIDGEKEEEEERHGEVETDSANKIAAAVVAAVTADVAATDESTPHPVEETNQVLGFYDGAGDQDTGNNTAVAASAPSKASKKVEKEEAIIIEEGAIWTHVDIDVLSGRGAHVNSSAGNKKFRALCFARKAQFDAGNHAVKRRLAVEICTIMKQSHGSRFLKRRQNKGPWYEMTQQEAILKAQQVMRDYKRPDRLLQRELMAAAGRKRTRATATPMDNVEVLPAPTEPLVEMPEGVNENDVLCGRGAFVNGHTGNIRLRTLAHERKAAFEKGSYNEKRALATEIVELIRGLEPAGRFLRKTKVKDGEDHPKDEWEEVDQEKAVHKACQVMRDIDRTDRKERDERRRLKKLRKEETNTLGPAAAAAAAAAPPQEVAAPSNKLDEDANQQQEAVEEAIAAAAAPTEKEEEDELVTESV